MQLISGASQGKSAFKQTSKHEGVLYVYMQEHVWEREYRRQRGEQRKRKGESKRQKEKGREKDVWERNTKQEKKARGGKEEIEMSAERVCCVLLYLSCVYFLNYVEQSLFCLTMKKHLDKRTLFKEVPGLSVRTEYAHKVLACHVIEFLSRHYLNCFHMAQVFFIKTHPLRCHVKKSYQISLALSGSQIPLGFMPIGLSALSV